MKDFIKDVSMRLIIEGGPRVSDGDAACPAQSGQQIKQTCKRWLKILDIYTMGGPQELCIFGGGAGGALAPPLEKFISLAGQKRDFGRT